MGQDLFAPPSADEIKQAKALAQPNQDLFAPPTAEELVKPPGPAQTFVEHGVNSMAMGYLPQIYGGVRAVGDMVTGQNYPPDTYVKERDKESRQLEAEAKENPKAAMIGSLGGTVANAYMLPIPGLGAGGGLIKGAAKGVTSGALQGAVQNPGDIEGKVDPLQIQPRIANAETGALVGGGAGLASGVASKALSGLARSPETLKNVGESAAVSAAGGMLKDFRQLEGKGKVNSLGRFARDNGLVKAGDTVDDVAEKSDSLRKAAGGKLQKLYADAKAALGAGATATGFNPVRDKDALLKEVGKSMGNQEGKKGALARLSDYIDQLIEDHGNKTLDPKTSQDIKTEMDKVAGWARNPMTKQPATESAYQDARRIISKKIDDDIAQLGKSSGNPEALKQLKQANLEYGNSKQLSDMATDRVQRNLANRRISLTDTIAGSAGGVAGAGISGLMDDHNPAHSAGYGLLGAIAAGGLNRMGRKYGSANISAAADTASPLMRYSGIPTAARGAVLLMPNAGIMGRLAASKNKNGLLNKGLVNGQD